MKGFAQNSRNPAGWTHGAPNYKRVVKEGRASYRKRVEMRSFDTQEEKDFRDGLLVLLDAMKNYTDRSVQYLKDCGAPGELVEAEDEAFFRILKTCPCYGVDNIDDRTYPRMAEKEECPLVILSQLSAEKQLPVPLQC